MAPKVGKGAVPATREGAAGKTEGSAPRKLAGFELSLALSSQVLPFIYLMWLLNFFLVIPIHAIMMSQLFLEVCTWKNEVASLPGLSAPWHGERQRWAPEQEWDRIV